MEERDWLKRIDWQKGTVRCGDSEYLLLDRDFHTVTPENPTALTAEEQQVVDGLVRAFAESSERLQRHVQFLYAHGALYKICNGNLLYHGAVPMTHGRRICRPRL